MTMPQHAALPYEPVAVDAADIITVYEAIGNADWGDTATQALARMRGAVPATYGEEDPLRIRLGAALAEGLSENMKALIDGERLLDMLVAAARG